MVALDDGRNTPEQVPGRRVGSRLADDRPFLQEIGKHLAGQIDIIRDIGIQVDQGRSAVDPRLDVVRPGLQPDVAGDMLRDSGKDTFRISGRAQEHQFRPGPVSQKPPESLQQVLGRPFPIDASGIQENRIRTRKGRRIHRKAGYGRQVDTGRDRRSLLKHGTLIGQHLIADRCQETDPPADPRPKPERSLAITPVPDPCRRSGNRIDTITCPGPSVALMQVCARFQCPEPVIGAKAQDDVILPFEPVLQPMGQMTGNPILAGPGEQPPFCPVFHARILHLKDPAGPDRDGRPIGARGDIQLAQG